MEVTLNSPGGKLGKRGKNEEDRNQGRSSKAQRGGPDPKAKSLKRPDQSKPLQGAKTKEPGPTLKGKEGI